MMVLAAKFAHQARALIPLPLVKEQEELYAAIVLLESTLQTMVLDAKTVKLRNLLLLEAPVPIVRRGSIPHWGRI